MPKHSRYVVGVCDNDKRYPEGMITHSNVEENIVMHKLSLNETRRKALINQIGKGRKDFDVPNNFFVCSNHCLDGKPTQTDAGPTLFLTASTNTNPESKKRT